MMGRRQVFIDLVAKALSPVLDTQYVCPTKVAKINEIEVSAILYCRK